MNEPLSLKSVRVSDPLFGHYTKMLYSKMIPYQWDVLNDRASSGARGGSIHNFRVAAGLETGEFMGNIFQDSDLAKWLEAVAYSLQTHPDEALEKDADSCIELMKAAQGSDGYLNTYFTLVEPDGRWTNLMEGHELYCAGHMIEAAVAYFEATGKREFLDIVCRMADLINDVFGPEPNKLKGYPGHEEIELALVKLYHATGEVRYLSLAKFFIDQRGQKPLYFPAELARRGGKTHFESDLMIDGFYSQSHKPVREQSEAVGHAVRATYLYCAMADIARETSDEELKNACLKIYDDIVGRKMFITGGIGSSAWGERFTSAYDLPGDRCYCETCASIGLSLFAMRMGRLTGEARYFDTVERALYNTVLAGVNRDGDRFFYVNPLQVVPEICEGNALLSHIKTSRQIWFDVACCPTNIARTLGSIAQYCYTWTGDELYAHLFLACEAELPDGSTLKLDSKYPASGSLSYDILARSSFTLALRVPEHSPMISLIVDEKPVTVKQHKGYARVVLSEGRHKVAAELDVRPRFVYSDPRVPSTAGKTALTLGPIVYCIEEIDNGKYLSSLSADTGVKPELVENPVDKATPALKIRGWADALPEKADLYGDMVPSRSNREILAVPYYCWNNRGPGEMFVWIRRG